MKFAGIAPTALAMLSMTFAPADASHKRHHRMSHSVNSGNPNGTASGPAAES
jgi:hypothetical protein